MFKKTILFFMLSFSLFLPSLKANVLFKNSSGSKIVMFVLESVLIRQSLMSLFAIDLIGWRKTKL